MLKKTITYTDYNGNKRTEDFYFNLSKAELMEMEMSTSGGLTALVRRIINTQDTSEMMKVFKEIILKSYGEKSDDGKRFIKSKELAEAFSQTDAYSELFMELLGETDAVSGFIKGIVPSDVASQIDESAVASVNA